MSERARLRATRTNREVEQRGRDGFSSAGLWRRTGWLPIEYVRSPDDLRPLVEWLRFDLRARYPRIWRRLLAECETGLRWYSGTPRGDNYRTIINHGGENIVENPGLSERTIGDLVDPWRSGSAMFVVNVVSREMGFDAAAWDLDRLLSMYAGIERDAARRNVES